MVVHREEFDWVRRLIICEGICRDYELLHITRFSLLLLRDCVFCGMAKQRSTLVDLSGQSPVGRLSALFDDTSLRVFGGQYMFST